MFQHNLNPNNDNSNDSFTIENNIHRYLIWKSNYPFHFKSIGTVDYHTEEINTKINLDLMAQLLMNNRKLY